MDIEKVRMEYELPKNMPESKVEKWLEDKEYFEQFTNLTYMELRQKVNERKCKMTTIFRMCSKYIPTLVITTKCHICGTEEELSWELMKSRGMKRPTDTWANNYYCGDCYEKHIKEVRAEENKLAKYTGKEKLFKDYSKHWGIYGIMIGSKLVYVDKTAEDFRWSWLKHEARMKKGEEELYVAMRENKFRFVVLVDLSRMPGGKRLTTREVECMELALLTSFKPMYNYEGVRGPYIHSKGRRNLFLDTLGENLSGAELAK